MYYNNLNIFHGVGTLVLIAKNSTKLDLKKCFCVAKAGIKEVLF